MKIILCNLLYFEEKYYRDKHYTPEHIGLEYIAENLRNNHHSVKIIDFNSINFDQQILFKMIDTFKPELIGFSTYHSSFKKILEVSEEIKKRSNIHITLGGVHVSFSPLFILRKHLKIDSIVFGEGEIPMSSLANEIENKTLGTRTIPGVAYRLKSKIIISNKSVLFKDFDKTILLSRDILEQRLKLGFYPSARIQGSRGCYSNCYFCPVRPFTYLHKNFELRRVRTPKHIVEEINYLNQKYHIKEFIFVDSDFLGTTENDYNRIVEFIDRLKLSKLNIKFRINARADSVIKHEENFLKLKKMGLMVIFVGFEFGNDEDLLLYNKNIMLNENLMAAEILNKFEIPFEAGFIMFHPYITLKKLKQNADFLLKINKAYIFKHFVNDMDVYPGTFQLYKLKEDNLLNDDYLYNEKCYKYSDKKIAEFFSSLKKTALIKSEQDRKLWNNELFGKRLNKNDLEKIGRKNYNFFIKKIREFEEL